MPRQNSAQLNVRSTFARARALELSRQTGMTATQIVEDALRGYVPPGEKQPVGRLIRRGPVLVLPDDGLPVSLDTANQALDEARERDLF